MGSIDQVKRRFVEDGFESCLCRKTSIRTYEKKMDGDTEAHLIVISCNKPPREFSKWSFRMLADKMVKLEYVESLSHGTVRGVLKKNEIKPWRVNGWIIPPKQNAQFMANMENV